MISLLISLYIIGLVLNLKSLFKKRVNQSIEEFAVEIKMTVEKTKVSFVLIGMLLIGVTSLILLITAITLKNQFITLFGAIYLAIYVLTYLNQVSLLSKEKVIGDHITIKAYYLLFKSYVIYCLVQMALN